MILFIEFLLLVFLHSCASQSLSDEESQKTAKLGKNPLVSREASNSPLATENPARKSKPVNLLKEVSRLWSLGYFEAARKKFETLDSSRYSHALDQEKWRILRSRLYTNHWRGAQLGLLGENFAAIMVDRDDIWAGTWTGGLARLAWASNEKTTFDPGAPSLALRTVNRILRHKDSIFLLRYGTLERYDLRTSSWSQEKKLPISQRLQDILIVDDQFYLASLGGGLWRKKGEEWEKLSIPGLFINHLEKGNRKEILIATMDKGLYILKAENDGDQWLRPPEGDLRKQNITALAVGARSIFAGSYGAGAYLWDRQKNSVEKFGIKELGNLWVLAIVESAGRFFLGTFGSGIAVYNSQEKTWGNIGFLDGLRSNDVASLALAPDDALWVGSLEGGILRISREVYYK